MEDLTTTAKQLTREGTMKKHYDTTTNLARKYGKPERLFKEKECKAITEIQE